MNEKEIPGVLLIFTVNATSLNPKLKQIVHFKLFILLQVYILLVLKGATLIIYGNCCYREVIKWVFQTTILMMFLIDSSENLSAQQR